MAQAQKAKVLQIKLNPSMLNTGDRIKLASVLTQMTPKSAVYASTPALKEVADKTLASGAAVQAAAIDVNDAELTLAAARSVLAATQTEFDKDVLCFKSVAEHSCKTEDEINGLGFNRRGPKAAPAALTPPDSIVVKEGKEKGSMVVHVQRAGRGGAFKAEISPDPVGPGTWQSIPGTGGRRMLTGYVSGASYWIRFRSVRANEESAWSNPVVAVAR
jgi:hypothetical protein